MSVEKVTVRFSNDACDKEIKVTVSIDDNDDNMDVNVDFGDGGSKSHHGYYVAVYEAFMCDLLELA